MLHIILYIIYYIIHAVHVPYMYSQLHTSTLFAPNFHIPLPGDLEHLRVVKQERHAQFAKEHGMSR